MILFDDPAQPLALERQRLGRLAENVPVLFAQQPMGLLFRRAEEAKQRRRLLFARIAWAAGELALMGIVLWGVSR